MMACVSCVQQLCFEWWLPHGKMVSPDQPREPDEITKRSDKKKIILIMIQMLEFVALLNISRFENISILLVCAYAHKQADKHNLKFCWLMFLHFVGDWEFVSVQEIIYEQLKCFPKCFSLGESQSDSWGLNIQSGLEK